MSALPELNWTAESYLAYERTSLERNEFLNGEVVALAGATARHNLIVGNTYASLHGQLRKRPYVVYPSDMRLKVSRTGLYTYPDIFVICGTPEFEDNQGDTLLNPTVIIEVLSLSTENYDRGKKFQHYRTLETLQEYLLIAQDSQRIEHYRRQQDGRWILTDINQPDASLDLRAIDCNLLIADMYEKVSLDAE